MSIRPILETRNAVPTMEGAGVHLHRAFGFQDPSELDPFLLFDDFRNDTPAHCHSTHLISDLSFTLFKFSQCFHPMHQQCDTRHHQL